MKELSLFADNGTRKYLVQSERLAFMSAATEADPDIRLFCEVLVHTGCRLTEALNLRPSHIDLGSKAMTFRTLKQRNVLRFRQVPVSDDLLWRINTWVQCKPCCNGRLFPIHRETGWRWVKRVMERANLRGTFASSRGLRHGFAVNAIQSGVPQTVVQKWLGHARLETTAIYSNVVGPEERHLMQRLWLLAA